MRASLVHCERGATVTEHAIALPLFIGFLLVTFDFLRLSYLRLSLQFAITDMSRVASITPVDAAYNPLTDLQNRLQSIGVTWNTANDRLTICSQQTFGTAACPVGSINRGRASEIIVYQARMQVNLFLPRNSRWTLGRGNIDLNGMVLVKNEPTL